MAHSQKVNSIDPVEKKVNKLIAGMTLEEKVGQMTKVTLGVAGTKIDDGLGALKLKDAVVYHGVDSILNVSNHALSVPQWNALLKQIADEANKTRLKIPAIYGLDGIHG